MKYSDVLATWLREIGYTHCFFVSGGNIMHLLESCSKQFHCVAVVHEVAAGIAAEYFNEVSQGGRAFALVTAGPGLTNIITAMAGAYLESRELLVIGGQVKVNDLARGSLRQRGIQEIDGVAIAAPVAVKSVLMDKLMNHSEFIGVAEAGSYGRKGPVFIEIPLDIQGAEADDSAMSRVRCESRSSTFEGISDFTFLELITKLKRAKRPVLLLGGGVNRVTATRLLDRLGALGIPLMVTWNGLDRVPELHPMFFGRPNTWGQRSANILMQQSDLLIALGTRLGLQQTGFNWQQFVPGGEVIQVECDRSELAKGHPRVDLPIHGDANEALELIAGLDDIPNYSEWIAYCREVRSLIPLDDPQNLTGDGFISPYRFCLTLSELCLPEDVIIPCSSGGANTVMHQTFQIKQGQRAFNNGGLAAMGYGLGGAIGAAIAAHGRRTILVEGDGGFIQNLQELGTVVANKLNMKIFIFDNNGYASIRMTQRNYFAGHYVGCDTETGLGFPDWGQLFAAYRIPMMAIGPEFESDQEFLRRFESTSTEAFLVMIDPEQTYFPKIASRVAENGGMESNPLHLMSPDLPAELKAKVFRYLTV